jgi:PadR family transcriptional regulator AphA
MAPPKRTHGLEYALLGLLAAKPCHGYELHKEISALEGLGLVWRVKQAQLYALLDKLEGEGYITARQVTSESHPPRKEYHLTPTGSQAFTDWLKAPVEHGRELRQDFLAKFFFARQQGQEAANQVLVAQHNRLVDLLARLEAESASLDADQDFERQVYRFRMQQLQAMLDWLDTCMIEP